ncbi:hypothetical protein [Enterococcus sp. LJL51]|uniref:hypothetical protein n=1 Tax=Enterococcus sp. LJL51 TaxID=3416656 RepID=UPI003CEB5315
MTIILLVILFLVIILFFSFKNKKAGLIIAGALIALVIGGSQYIFYVEPLMEKKQAVENYFKYFEETFGFRDSVDNYGWEDDYTRQPELTFTFEAYGSKRTLRNSTIGTVRKIQDESGIRVLRNHIYYHYADYIIEHFAYDENVGNDFFSVKEYLSRKGYECGLDTSLYFPEENEGYELYVDKSIQPNIRINRSNRNVSLEEEMNFYKGKSMEDFDYQKYMEYFDYGVVLTGYYEPKEGKEPEPLNKKELDKVVEEAMQNERIEIVLKEFDEQE